MKWTLFLLLCLVGISYQQRFYPSGSYSYKDPRFVFYYPQLGPYLDSSVCKLNLTNFFQLKIVFSHFNQDYDDGQQMYPDIESRRPVFSNLIRPQKKFTFRNNLSSSANTLTTTKYSFVSSTATVLSVQSCIGIAQFVVSNSSAVFTFQSGSRGQYLFSPGCDFSGNDIGNVNNINSLAGCGSLCAANSSCDHFTWNAVTNICFLKKATNPAANACPAGAGVCFCGYVISRSTFTATVCSRRRRSAEIIDLLEESIIGPSAVNG